MEEAGYTRSYRRRWTHPAFKNLRDAAIWSWMTDAAAWRDTAIRFCGQSIQVKRGQLVTSERFLAEGFCVDRQVILRLLDNLVSEHMVSLQKTHGGTIVTICNYDKYQASAEGENPQENPSRTHDEPTANPNKKEEKEGKESKKYRFEGKTIRLTEEDYGRWKRSFYAITDIDAELTRIDSQVEGRGWFNAAANKLNYKHQALLAKRAEQEPQKPNPDVRLANLASVIKRGFAKQDKIWVSRVSSSDAADCLKANLITPDEATWCGATVTKFVSRESTEAA